MTYAHSKKIPRKSRIASHNTENLKSFISPAILKMKDYNTESQDCEHGGEGIESQPSSMHKTKTFHPTRDAISLRAFLYQLLALLTAFSLGYLIAQQRHITTPNLSSTSLQTSAPTRQLFAYNRTFSSPPSNITNQAWIDLFPAHHGFLVHPTLAPNLSVVAVFHQLHCVVRTALLPFTAAI